MAEVDEKNRSKMDIEAEELLKKIKKDKERLDALDKKLERQLW